MARQHASKDEVLKKLEQSMNHCNSHHEPVQPLFEDVVDKVITPKTCSHDHQLRRREMKALFPVLLTRETRGMVPTITLPPMSITLEPAEFLDLWLTKWVTKFVREWASLPSERYARQKGTVTDEALITMVSSPNHAGSRERALEWARHHNLYMSAENVGGSLLEEYIASKTSAYGWIWCRGKILTAIDFCNDECTSMFQVKNKTNTENSSGRGFRESRGASVWCRMRAARRAGNIETYWPRLVDIIREGSTSSTHVPHDLMSEEDYLAFVEKVSMANPDLITDDEG